MAWRGAILIFVLSILVFAPGAFADSLLDDFLQAPAKFLNHNFSALIDVPEPEPDFSLSDEERAKIEDYYKNTIDLSTCAFNPSISKPWIERVSTVALYYDRTYKKLKAAGYPERVWLPKLQAVVLTQVNKIAKLLRNGQPVPTANRLDGVYPWEMDLYNSLVSYANSSDQKILYPDEPRKSCGGDFIGYVRVRSDPPNATIQLLSEFSFKLCKSQGRNAYSDCLGWTEVNPNNGVPAGLYRYFASWPDGTTTCNLQDLTPSQGWPDPDDEPRIEIAKTNSPCPD
ncbi:hypothetical protein ELI00_37490 [Rhizobium ruizarguesonis]|uniref:hypothetical protein n=1 Tax=Rhizobium ruizarguesonis TaxID=2081791 RepID=UPI001031B934|nr:hypothetical protein [Rhizobium ruizarguesonis]TAX63340.1 hypothetical protein ELI00_37490 [Rhizobium ruizarguesonis]